MPAPHDIIAIVKSHQMTLRNIPEKANRKLRDVARREGKSLNRVALEALERGLGIADEQVEYHDLDDLAGTWVEDPEFDRVIGEMDRVDPELWK
jgi:plasmid stability protein